MVVQRQSNGSQMEFEVTGERGETDDRSIHGSRLKAPPTARVAAVDVNWGSQVKEDRQILKTTALSASYEEVRKKTSGELFFERGVLLHSRDKHRYFGG